MYAKNNKISDRQAMRLITFDILGYSALLVPAALAGSAGRDGIFSIGIGVAAGLLYLRLLKNGTQEMKGNYSQHLTETCGATIGMILKAGYLLYFLLLAGRVACVFAELVASELLERQFQLILLIILALVYYGVSGGIEGRARVYEILFWIVLLPLVIMMAFACPAVSTDYWTPVFESGLVAVLKGGYQTFLCISVLCVIPFLAEHVKEKGKLYHCGKWAMLLTGSILAVLYLILLGMFGRNALATLDYPVVTMMSRIQITGGFLKRTDALMFGVWFFTLYALLSSLTFCGGKLWSFEKKGARWWLFGETLLIYLLAVCFHQSSAMKTYFMQYFCYIGTPFVVGVPAILWMLRKTENPKGGSDNEGTD